MERMHLDDRVKWLSPTKAAMYAGVSRSTIYNWVLKGYIRQELGGKHRISRTDLDKLSGRYDRPIDN